MSFALHRSLKKRLSPIFFNLRPSSVLPPTPTRPSPLQPGWAAGLLHSHAKPLASGSVPFLGKDWRSHSPLCTGDQSIGLRRWWCPRLSRSGHRDLPERRERRRGRGGVTLTDASGDSAGAPPHRADKRPSASLFLRARHASSRPPLLRLLLDFQSLGFLQARPGWWPGPFHRRQFHNHVLLFHLLTGGPLALRFCFNRHRLSSVLWLSEVLSEDRER